MQVQNTLNRLGEIGLNGNTFNISTISSKFSCIQLFRLSRDHRQKKGFMERILNSLLILQIQGFHALLRSKFYKS